MLLDVIRCSRFFQRAIHIEHLQLMTTMDSFECLCALEHDPRHRASWRIGCGFIYWKPGGVPPTDHHGDRAGSRFTLKNENVLWTCVVVMSNAQVEIWEVLFPVRPQFCYNIIFLIRTFQLAYLHPGSQHYRGTMTTWFHALEHVLYLERSYRNCDGKTLSRLHCQNHRDVWTKLTEKNRNIETG